MIVLFSSAYKEPYLTCYTENTVYMFDVQQAEWVQTLCLKKVRTGARTSGVGDKIWWGG